MKSKTRNAQHRESKILEWDEYFGEHFHGEREPAMHTNIDELEILKPGVKSSQDKLKMNKVEGPHEILTEMLVTFKDFR